MTGRHRKRPGLHVRIPQQPAPRLVGMTDARTRIEHLIDASAMEHRHSGRYLALCGARVLAASLTDPGRDRCAECAR
ncbi:MAG: hypothetical protein JO296_12755 [Pseudonocardiales bacterium]|nr:hypothetical protein [Pseudonocardiales bacterium]